MSGPLNNWFTIPAGSFCDFESTLGYSVVGRTTFTFHDPYLYLIDAGKDFAGPLAGFIKIYDCSDPQGTLNLVSTTSTPVFSGPERPRIAPNNSNVLVLPYRRPNTPAQATTAGVPGQKPQLSCWDITNKAAPSLLDAIDLGYNSVAGEYNSPQDVQIIGDVACCAIGTGFSNDADAALVDISDPSNLSLLANYKNASSLSNRQCVKSATHFFLIGIQGSGGPLCVVSIAASGFSAAKITNGTTSDNPSGCAVDVSGNRIFISTSAGRLWVVDISNPASMATISLTLPFDPLPNDGNPMCFIPPTNRLYVGGTGQVIYVLDTSTATPTLLGIMDTSADPLELQPIQAECYGFAYTMFGSTDVILLGTAPLS